MSDYTAEIADTGSGSDEVTVLVGVGIEDLTCSLEALTLKNKLTVSEPKNHAMPNIALTGGVTGDISSFDKFSGSNSVVTVDNDVYYGSCPSSIRCQDPGTTFPKGITNYPGSPVAPSKTYTLSVYLKGTGRVKLTHISRKSSGIFSRSTISSTVTLNSDTWTRLSATLTFTSDEVYSSFYISSTSANILDFYVSAIQIEEGDTATDWEYTYAIDTPSIHTEETVSDTMVGTDLISQILTSLAIAEVPDIQEVITPYISFIILETSESTDIPYILARISESDNLSGDDDLSITSTIPISEDTTFEEVISVFTILAIPDANLSVSEIIRIFNEFSIDDRSEAIEEILIYVAMAIADEGVGVDEVAKRLIKYYESIIEISRTFDVNID